MVFRLRGLQLINVVRRVSQVDELKARYGNDIHVLAFDGSNEAQFLQQINQLTQGKGINYSKFLFFLRSHLNL